MHCSPFSRDRDRPLEYDVMVLHAAEARVLRVPAGAGWTLPHCTPAVTDFRRGRHSNEQRRAQYDLESVVQRCVAPRDDPVNAASSRVYVLKNRRTTTPLPRGGPWDSAAELDHVPLPMPEHRALMRRWLPASPAATVSALQAPWPDRAGLTTLQPGSRHNGRSSLSKYWGRSCRHGCGPCPA